MFLIGSGPGSVKVEGADIPWRISPMAVRRIVQHYGVGEVNKKWHLGWSHDRKGGTFVLRLRACQGDHNETVFRASTSSAALRSALTAIRMSSV